MKKKATPGPSADEVRRHRRPRRASREDRQVQKAIEEIVSKARQDAENFVSLAARAGGVEGLPDAIARKLKALLVASFEGSASYSPKLEHLAIELVMDPLGTRGVIPQEWSTLRSGGKWELRRRSGLLPALSPPVIVTGQLFDAILTAVMAGPRDLDGLRRTICRVIPPEQLGVSGVVSLPKLFDRVGPWPANTDRQQILDRWRGCLNRAGVEPVKPGSRAGSARAVYALDKVLQALEENTDISAAQVERARTIFGAIRTTGMPPGQKSQPT